MVCLLLALLVVMWMCLKEYRTAIGDMIGIGDSVAVVEEPEPFIEVDDEALQLRQSERPIDCIVIHCSASGDDYSMPVDSIIKQHRCKGWKNIGYHYYVSRDGVIHRGRDLKERGAHVYGHNETTIGICYEGGLRRAEQVIGMESIVVPEELKGVKYKSFHYMIDSTNVNATAIYGVPYVACDTRTKAQKMALRELIAHLKAIYPGIEVCGHRDFSRDINHDGVISPNEWIKECPSFDVKEEYQ